MLGAAQPSSAQRTLGIAATQRAADFRQTLDRKLTFVCPATDGQGVNVYGTDTYMDDSAICAAAIHAGALGRNAVGSVSIVLRQGPETFVGSERNGVTSRSYGRWDYSFTFATDSEPAAITWRTVWNLVPADFAAPIVVACPPGGSLDAPIWGTDTYVTDSSICVAGVHAGVITAEAGGALTVRRAPALDRYAASERNGVASRQWGSSADAFSVSAPPMAITRTGAEESNDLERAARARTTAPTGSTPEPAPTLRRLEVPQAADAPLRDAPPDATARIDSFARAAELERRIEAVAELIAELERQNAQLRRFITINGNTLEIRASRDVAFEAPNGLDVRAGDELIINAASETSIRIGGQLEIETTGGETRLQSPTVLVNGATRPVARSGDPAAPSPNGSAVAQGSTTLSSD